MWKYPCGHVVWASCFTFPATTAPYKPLRFTTLSLWCSKFKPLHLYPFLESIVFIFLFDPCVTDVIPSSGLLWLQPTLATWSRCPRRCTSMWTVEETPRPIKSWPSHSTSHILLRSDATPLLVSRPRFTLDSICGVFFFFLYCCAAVSSSPYEESISTGNRCVMLLASCNVSHYVERESSLTFISEYHNTQLPLQYVLRIYSGKFEGSLLLSVPILSRNCDILNYRG